MGLGGCASSAINREARLKAPFLLITDDWTKQVFGNGTTKHDLLNMDQVDRIRMSRAPHGREPRRGKENVDLDNGTGSVVQPRRRSASAQASGGVGGGLAAITILCEQAKEQRVIKRKKIARQTFRASPCTSQPASRDWDTAARVAFRAPPRWRADSGGGHPPCRSGGRDQG